MWQKGVAFECALDLAGRFPPPNTIAIAIRLFMKCLSVAEVARDRHRRATIIKFHNTIFALCLQFQKARRANLMSSTHCECVRMHTHNLEQLIVFWHCRQKCSGLWVHTTYHTINKIKRRQQ